MNGHCGLVASQQFLRAAEVNRVQVWRLPHPSLLLSFSHPHGCCCIGGYFEAGVLDVLVEAHKVGAVEHVLRHILMADAVPEHGAVEEGDGGSLISPDNAVQQLLVLQQVGGPHHLVAHLLALKTGHNLGSIPTSLETKKEKKRQPSAAVHIHIVTMQHRQNFQIVKDQVPWFEPTPCIL